MNTHPDLDLKKTIRPGLDILANEIVIGLKKRTRFRCNAAVYEPGLVVGVTQVSLLDYELAKIEQCHAELGRYSFAAQDSYSDIRAVPTIIARNTPQSPVRYMPSGVGQRIIDYYRDWIAQACPAGENTSNYGETVTADVSVLMAIMERVNLGKSVAEAKFMEMPDAFIDTNSDRDAILALIVHKDREQKVLELAQTLASQYNLPTEHAIDVFQFMITVTIDIEVDYLKLRIAEQI